MTTLAYEAPRQGSARLVPGGGAVFAAIIAVALAVLVGYPMIWLVLKALHPASGASLTFDNFVVAFTTPRYLMAVRDSLELALSVALLDLAIAVPIAWAVVRTDMPAKALVWSAVLGAFITPSFLGAIAWTLLAGPNAGWLNKWWMDLTHTSAGLFNIYSMPGLVAVIAFSTYPYAFLFTANALELMSSEMEDAAAMLGANRWRVMRSITVPLVLPAVVAGFIMAFLESIADLGAPLLIAVPARFQVITTQIFQFFEYPSRVELAAAYSLPLLMLTGLLLFAQRRLLTRKGFSTLTGRGGSQAIIRLGWWRFVFLGWCLLIAVLSFVLPNLALLSAALAKAWARGWVWSNLTLNNFQFILIQHPTTPRAIANSFMFSIFAACLAITLAFLAAYLVNRRLVRGAWVLGYATMLPYVIPGIVLAIGFLSAYTRPPFSLYGTPWIMILAFTSRFLPIGFITSDTALKSVHSELEDAARIAGAGRLSTLWEVTMPLVKRGIFGGWLLVVIAASRELSTAIFLFGPNTRVMSTVLIDLSEEGDFERLAALGVVMLLLTLALAAIGYAVLGRRFLARVD